MKDDRAPSFSEWQYITDAYAEAISAMEAGEPGAEERVRSLCERLSRFVQRFSSASPTPNGLAAPAARAQATE